jgi:hypothetical protein
MEDHYTILGISEDATFDEIKAARRVLVFKHHPDRNPQDIAAANSATIKINLAYEVLSDDKARRRYDELRRYITRPATEVWNAAQERAYTEARNAYQESEDAAKERVKKWFYERLGVRSTKRHRCYGLQGNGTGLDNLLSKIDRRLGDKVWEYRVTAAPESSDKMRYQIRVVCDPSKCGFREQHADWVEGYYFGLFKAGTPEDAEYNVQLANSWLADILKEAVYSYRIRVFFGIVGSLPAPWRCYLDLTVVLIISRYDAFFHASVPGLTKFARENTMEVATIFGQLAKDNGISPADLCWNQTMRKHLARQAENILRARRGIRTLPERKG